MESLDHGVDVHLPPVLFTCLPIHPQRLCLVLSQADLASCFQRGKPYIFTPVSETPRTFKQLQHAAHWQFQEQNSVDWNYLWQAPLLESEPVAGNYNWWTNLYQIALVRNIPPQARVALLSMCKFQLIVYLNQIMWSMITLYFPDEPPQASRCMWTVNTPAGPKQVPIWTYGGLLTQEIDATSIHSMTLREVVAWCMGKFI